ncbi:hypothetical protein L1049_020535 [Liquidambar formosana]|uniref:Uncharacterized protein n=1 Tax=Liquidambar formosana TaxID=63359 RepID=A0AAP0SD92_LIQFO
MATAATGMMLQCIFDGSISMHDTEIERRPYHRNCGCALHNSRGICSNACPQQRNISFPKKESLNDCSLSIPTSKSSSQPTFLSYSSVRNGEGANGVLSLR